MSAAPPILETHQLTGGYGKVQVLRGISIAVGEGERVGLFGPNGHGKTTLLKTISGLMRPWGGSIRFRGQAIERSSPGVIVGLGLIHVPQGNTLFPELTVQETLELGAFTPRVRANKAQNLERAFALFPRLAERRRQLCKTLSGGERQMVSISVGLMCEPRLLILDEPTLGLAPKVKDELCEAIGVISGGGVSLLLVEQDIEFLLALTDRLFMVDHGEVTREVRSETGLDHAQIMDLYFGVEARQ
ncbi:MAG: ABC transporter ATP-binding protein [Meiothermus sp.]|nr:ABC transporter ATP-binding protein [Meiothermus sp.]